MDEKRTPSYSQEEMKELVAAHAAEPGGLNDRVRELRSIIERLETLSEQLREQEETARARGWINGVVASLKVLAREAEGLRFV